MKSIVHTSGFFMLDNKDKSRDLPVFLNTYSNYYEQRPWRYPKGSKSNHIYYVLDGEGNIECEGEKASFKKGDFVFFRSNVPVKYYPKGKSYKVKYFTFSGIAAEKLFDYYDVPDWIVTDSTIFQKSFEKIFAYIDNEIELERISARLYSFAVEFGISQGSVNRKSAFERAITYIDNHYYHDISVSSIASYINASESSLFKQFKKQLNITPAAYINKLRIHRAKYYLLSQNELSVEEVGYMVGFHSPSYFIECFKRFEGKTPYAFKKEK